MLRDAKNDLHDYSNVLWDIAYNLEKLESPPPIDMIERISDIAISLQNISDDIDKLI